MTDLPRERQPDPALEERVVSTLVAAGLVRRRRAWPVWMAAAAAAVIVLAIGVSVLRPKHTLAQGNTYVVLLYEDSTYRPAPEGHGAERVAELARWADSLDAAGETRTCRPSRRVRARLGGLFMIRAADDSDAARIAAAVPLYEVGRAHRGQTIRRMR